MARSPAISLTVTLAAIGAALGGCSSRTNVAANANTSSLYSHVYVTVQAVWFNKSDVAGPDDSGWRQFPLSTPVTVDLVTYSGGNFANLATDLRLAPGSYSQVRLIPVDASTPLTASAQTVGATYNMEADYVDSSGITHQLPLELLNPDKGLGIQSSLKVPIGNIKPAVVAANSSATGSTPLAATGTTPGATALGIAAASSQNTTTAEFGVTFDASRDLAAFTYGGAYGVLFSSHLSAHDLSGSGGIQGQLTLTSLTGLTGPNGTLGLQVSAQSLTADGTRHFVVARAPVASDGSFTLYPLGANSSNNTSYDVVIHGPGIATMVIRNVIIPSTGRGVSTTGTSTTGTSGTAANPDTSPIKPANLVSIGTLTPRAASSYTANIATAAGAPLAAGAAIEFSQTLPSSGEVPYVIEAAPIDPFNQVLVPAQTLSSGTVDSGTYVSSGATITVVSAAPAEGAGTYQVSASAPLYADGPFGITVSAPTATGVTTAGPVTLAPLALASGSSAASLAAVVLPATVGKYDHGELMLSQNGQLIASAPLDAALAAGGGTVQLAGIPGGSSRSLFYLTVRAWNSSDPAGTLTRQWYPGAIDLRNSLSASAQLTID